MFIDNKYKKWYFTIINRAFKRSLTIYEKHHIIPRSLGGSNEKLNIVKLSPREHIICHRLLTKMTEGEYLIKMRYAFWGMSGNNIHCNRNLSSKQYEYARICIQKNLKNKTYEERYGKKHAEQIRKKQSDSAKGISKPWAGSNGLHPKTGENRHAKVWHITTPDGIEVRLIGAEFTKFCNDHNLSKGNFSTYGKTKGYTATCLGLASEFLNTVHQKLHAIVDKIC
jgi:hypothetical protein